MFHENTLRRLRATVRNSVVWGVAWGTLIHGLLEHAMRHKTATRDDLRRLAMWLTVEEPTLRTVIDDALRTVEAVAQAQFWEVAKSSEHHVEVPFCISSTSAAAPPALTIGVVDLVHRVADHWNVVDYKTDRSDPLPTVKYDAQLRTYRKMWQQMTGETVQAQLVSTRVFPPR